HIASTGDLTNTYGLGARPTEPLPRRTLDVAAAEVLTGDGIAAIWSDILDQTVSYGGNDLNAFETAMRSATPAWMAYDLRLMMRSFQQYGMQTTAADGEQLQTLLDRPLRTYREFAHE